MMGVRLQTPESMLASARGHIAQGQDPHHLLAVAIGWRDKWAALAEEDAAEPGKLDGRASIYSGETYAEARDRWEGYRVLLVEELRTRDGVNV